MWLLSSGALFMVTSGGCSTDPPHRAFASMPPWWFWICLRSTTHRPWESLMACATAWLQNAVQAEHRHRVIVVVDEAWAILSNLGNWGMAAEDHPRLVARSTCQCSSRVTICTMNGTCATSESSSPTITEWSPTS